MSVQRRGWGCAGVPVTLGKRAPWAHSHCREGRGESEVGGTFHNSGKKCRVGRRGPTPAASAHLQEPGLVAGHVYRRHWRVALRLMGAQP